jgi:hypothetical protein
VNKLVDNVDLDILFQILQEDARTIEERWKTKQNFEVQQWSIRERDERLTYPPQGGKRLNIVQRIKKTSCFTK